MRQLIDYINEAGYGKAGSMSYKLDPVAQEVISKADLDKFYQQLMDSFKNIAGYDGKLDIDVNLGHDWKHQWQYAENNGKRIIFLSFHIYPENWDDEEYLWDKLIKFFTKIYSIKPGNHSVGLDYAVPVKPGKDLKFDLTPKATFSVALATNMVPTFYISIDIDDIADIWNKINGNIVDFNFKKFGTPGGINDAAGRTLQEGDIVAFMRRAGTGGMEMGVVQSVKKRVTINTESRNTVTLDGSQICLVQRGNLVVS